MRKHKILLMTDELKRRNWIYELQAMGFTAGPNGEPFEEMGYYDVRSYLMVEQIRAGTDVDIESKANAMF